MGDRWELVLEAVAYMGGSDQDALDELFNAADEIRYGWMGATVTPYVVLPSLRTREA